MPKKKPKTSGDAGSHDTSNLNQIDAYTHDDKTRYNIPPVGMAKFDTVASPEAKYEYDPHIDTSLQWAGKKEGMTGQVQMVYLDLPYGIKYDSNFQPFVNKYD